MVKALAKARSSRGSGGRGRYGRGVAEVLIIEDDDRIRPLLVRGLRECGHTVTSAPTGMGGLQLAVDSSPDLVVLDLGLPDVDGTQVLSMLRAVSQVPVIIASARADDPSLVGALDAGADDYVVKPFTSAQLDARIRAVLRRVEAGRQRPSTITVGGLAVDLAGRRVHLDGTEVDLTPREFDLLAHLAERPGRGGDQARPARRGVAPAVGRVGQDGRRAPVVAAPQARRDRRRPALPDHGARRRRTPRGTVPDAPADRGRLRCAAASW